MWWRRVKVVEVVEVHALAVWVEREVGVGVVMVRVEMVGEVEMVWW